MHHTDMVLGVDLIHNPEFTICEFYQICTDLPELIRMTEDLFKELYSTAEAASQRLSSVLPPHLPALHTSSLPAGKYPQMSFIPTLETLIQEKLPDWTFPNLNTRKEFKEAHPLLLDTLSKLGVLKSPVDTSTSIPRILDMLASNVLEPKIKEPTWITFHPECMAPLAKSFAQEGSGHKVSARAELFIMGREYVNCYEEENSPLEQRRKFEQQQKQHGPDQNKPIDENYLRALEWGMPPTGGWGCGVDRLIMLFARRRRIADVLPFGNLINVARLGNSRLKGDVIPMKKKQE